MKRETLQRPTEVIDDFDTAAEQNRSVDIQQYVNRLPDSKRASACAQMLCIAIRRHVASERPLWFDALLESWMWQYRNAICHELTGLLFAANGLAQSFRIDRFGAYEAIEVKGFGGSAIVFLGRHRERPRELVAIKVAHPRYPEAANLLRSEANTLLRLKQSPEELANVPQFLTLDKTPLGWTYLVTRWIDGSPLDGWLDNNKNFYRRLVAAYQVALQVQGLHRAGCNHGDLSPSNILISEGRTLTASLIDFGNASDGFKETALKALTYHYAAPELLGGDDARPSLKSDCWSLAVILFQMLTGSHPYGKNLDGARTREELAAHFSQPTMVARPRDNAGEFWDKLEMCLCPRPGERLDSSTLLASVPTPSIYLRPKDPGKGEQFDHRRLRRRSALVMVGVILFAAAAAFTFIHAWQTKTSAMNGPRSNRPSVDGVSQPDDSSLYYTNSIAMKFRRIEPGSFSMGSPPTEMNNEDGTKRVGYGEEDQRHVMLSRPFYLAVNDVTREDFGRFVEATNYRTDAEVANLGKSSSSASWHRAGTQPDDPRQPVVMVSWRDANEFARWLSKLEHRTYRLPLEAEWEYACRANSPQYQKFNTGNTLTVNQANIAESLGKPGSHTTRVGSYPPNAWGLFDMHGNVWQWVYDREIDRSAGPALYPDPIRDSDLTSLRATCGGSYCYPANYARSANRFCDSPTNATTDRGFRVALEP